MKLHPGDAGPAAATSAGFVRELLRATDLETLGHLVAREASRGFGVSRLALAWWSRTPQSGNAVPMLVSPAGVLSESAHRWLESQPAGSRRVQAPLTVVDLMSGVIGQALLAWPGDIDAPQTPEWTRFVEDVAGVCGRLLELESLTQSVLRLERAERLQRSLYAIADMASSDLDMPDMLRSIHDVVGELMYAENFFIVQVDPELDGLRFLYFADTEDPAQPGPDEVIPIRSIPNSLTLAMLRSGQVQMGPSDQ